jgi:transposase
MIARMFTTHRRTYVYQAKGKVVAQYLPAADCLEEKIMERLHMNHLRDLIRRLRAGESERRIARDMRISRPTVHKYHELAQREGYLEAKTEIPDDETLQAVLGPGPQPPKIASSLEPYGQVVETLHKQEVEMVAIWQRLKEAYGYTGSYSAVRRYVRHLEPEAVEAYTRVHSAPGDEMQVDFGAVGPLFDPASGRVRTAYAFVATLSYSRHQYAELVFDQKVVTWIGLHRRALEYFGGVPRRVVPDNLKAAVLKALVHDAVLGEAYRQMALHYGFLISPTIPASPRHKGKVESGVHYVQRNFMAGQQFADIQAANQHLKNWILEVAGIRNHGTTHQAPLYLFTEFERAALQPLPVEPFSLCEVRTAKVHPDCHVVVSGSFYSAPYAYVGKKLDVYVRERVVELYQSQKLVASHVRCGAPGQWQTRLEHYPPHKAAYLQRTPDFCRRRAAGLGPATHQVVEALLSERPLDRLRSVQAILKLEESVGPQRLEAACARAVYYGDFRYRRIKDILNAALDREPLPEASAAQPASPHAFARPATDFFIGVQP